MKKENIARELLTRSNQRTKTLKRAIKKLEYGLLEKNISDFLSDIELKVAITFYTKLVNDLFFAGPHYRIAAVYANDQLQRMIDWRDARKRHRCAKVINIGKGYNIKCIEVTNGFKVDIQHPNSGWQLWFSVINHKFISPNANVTKKWILDSLKNVKVKGPLGKWLGTDVNYN